MRATTAASTPHRGYGAQRVVTCRLDRGVPGSRLEEFRSHAGGRRSVSSRRILTSLAEQGTQQARDFRIDHRRLPKIFAATNRKVKHLRTLATSLMLIGQPASQDRGAATKAFAVSASPMASLVRRLEGGNGKFLAELMTRADSFEGEIHRGRQLKTPSVVATTGGV